MNIVAIKESGGTVERVSQLRQALPETFDILSGDDSLTLAFMAAGAHGVISVASNIIPKEIARLVSDCAAEKMDAARELHLRFYQLFKDLFIEPNPVPIKTALAMAGKMQPDVRLPLCEMSKDNLRRLRTTLEQLGLITK